MCASSPVDGEGFAVATQVRRGEDQAGRPVAAGNDDDAQMDRGTVGDGCLDALVQTPVRAPQSRWEEQKLNKLGTDPFIDATIY